MNLPSRRAALQSLVLPLVAASVGARAQTYPAKPIRLLVGFAPGGGTDLLARVVAQGMSEKLGVPVTVDNRPGANMILATDLASKAAPDGYTLGIAAVPSVTNPSLYAKLPFDTAKDFTWITQLTSTSLVLLANNAVPVQSIRDVMALARSKPGELAYGSSGAGGSNHLCAVLIEQMAGIRMIHVPYKGIAPSLTDLMGGRISLMFADTSVAPYIQSGKVKAIAVSTARRSSVLPDVPTIAESGLPGYDVSAWYGLCGPAGLPKPVVSAIARTAADVLQMPAVREKLAGWGQTAVGSSPDEFDAFVKKELAMWTRTIKSADIRLD